MKFAAIILPAMLVAGAGAQVQFQPETGTGLVVTAADCRRLVTRHTPAPDVAFRPGVDVRGLAVVPAEVSSGQRIEIPDEIRIDIIIPVRDLLGEEAPPGTARGEVRVGSVTVSGDRLAYEGQPLDDAAQAAIAAECRRILNHTL